MVKVLEALVERSTSAVRARWITGLLFRRECGVDMEYLGEKQVWAHSIQLLTELTLISLRHLTGNLRPLKAVEEVIASPWLRQFFTLTFSLSVRVLPPSPTNRLPG